MTNKFLSLLGLAERAGKLTSGEDQVLQAIQKRKAHLVIIAGDASNNTVKKFTNKCTYYRIPILAALDRYMLGRATGKAERVTIAVLDKGFADGLTKAHDANGGQNNLEVKGIE